MTNLDLLPGFLLFVLSFLPDLKLIRADTESLVFWPTLLRLMSVLLVATHLRWILAVTVTSLLFTSFIVWVNRILCSSLLLPYFRMEHRWKKLCTGWNKTKSVFITCVHFYFCPQKDKIEHLVLAPLCSLQGMFTAPQKLIQKRYDKLLDYCSRLERSSSSTTSSSPSPVSEDPSGPARRDYEALNALLLEELQRFNMAAYTILTNCVLYLAALLRELMGKILHGAPSIHQLPVRTLFIIHIV